MRVIKPARIREFAESYPDALEALRRWLRLAELGKWTSFVKVRESVASADEIIAGSDRPVVIFNIRGNRYRLITAVHYNRGMVYVLRFMTHAEYSKNKWRDHL